LFALLTGRIPGEDDTTTGTLFAILLLLVVMGITMVSRKITRGLELANLTAIGIQLAFLLVIDLLVVPFSVWWDGFRGLITPPATRGQRRHRARRPGRVHGAGVRAELVCDEPLPRQGLRHGLRVGYLSGLRGEQREVQAVGVTFPDDEKNAALWKRWMGYLKLDMWLVFLRRGHDRHVPADHPHAADGAAVRSEADPGQRPTFVASILDQEYGRWLFSIALFVGFLILFDTQLGIFEALVRNTTDAVNTSPRLQQAIAGDPRRFYYPFMLVLTAVIGLFLQFFQPAKLVLISANMSNFGALIFPFMLIYLNSKLPKAARPKGWVYLVLILNFLFFGFFFINFVFDQFTGEALVKF
jgi:hypothetical protein